MEGMCALGEGRPESVNGTKPSRDSRLSAVASGKSAKFDAKCDIGDSDAALKNSNPGSLLADMGVGETSSHWGAYKGIVSAFE